MGEPVLQLAPPLLLDGRLRDGVEPQQAEGRKEGRSVDRSVGWGVRFTPSSFGQIDLLRSHSVARRVGNS